VVEVTVRDDHEIQVVEPRAGGFDVSREDVGVVPGVEQDALAAVLHQRRIPPILRHPGRLAEGVVEDGDAIRGSRRDFVQAVRREGQRDQDDDGRGRGWGLQHEGPPESSSLYRGTRTDAPGGRQ
jgi:hypothetical protein